MVPSAELRVYQPLEAFPPDEQAHWERHIVDGALRLSGQRHRQAVTSEGHGMLTPGGEDGAYVKVVDGAYYVCPWRTRLRVLAAIISFRKASTFDDPSMFVSDEHVRRARRELRRMRRRDPNQISAIMHSPWHVPVRWFVLFDDHERRLLEHEGHHRLSYLTATRRALVRAEEVVPPLRRSELGPIADLIVELHQWISLFDVNSILELDYGGLSHLMTWDEMDDDHSARDLHDAIRALAEQRFPRSAELYQAVLTRAAELRAHEGLN
ncbi:MAG TPA: hypothetical protein VFK59_09755 [Actinomycetota bacterium]|nr:hypothetical protein [Actinomycetota bacterium]